MRFFLTTNFNFQQVYSCVVDKMIKRTGFDVPTVNLC